MAFRCSLCKEKLKENDSYFCSSCESIFHYRCLVPGYKRDHQCPSCKSLTPLWRFYDGIPDSILYVKPPFIREEPIQSTHNPHLSSQDEGTPKTDEELLDTENVMCVYIPHNEEYRYLKLIAKVFFFLLLTAIGVKTLLNAGGWDVTQIAIGIFIIMIGLSFISEGIKYLAILVIMWIVITAVVSPLSQNFIAAAVSTFNTILIVIEFFKHIDKMRNLAFFFLNLILFISFLILFNFLFLRIISAVIVEIILTFGAVLAVLSLISTEEKKTAQFEIRYKCQACGKLLKKKKLIDGYCKKCHSLYAAAAAHQQHPAFRPHPPQL
jgi:hypothetical protein